jgi:hypothetical protein
MRPPPTLVSRGPLPSLGASFLSFPSSSTLHSLPRDGREFGWDVSARSLGTRHHRTQGPQARPAFHLHAAGLCGELNLYITGVCVRHVASSAPTRTPHPFFGLRASPYRNLHGPCDRYMYRERTPRTRTRPTTARTAAPSRPRPHGPVFSSPDFPSPAASAAARACASMACRKASTLLPCASAAAPALVSRLKLAKMEL